MAKWLTRDRSKPHSRAEIGLLDEVQLLALQFVGLPSTGPPSAEEAQRRIRVHEALKKAARRLDHHRRENGLYEAPRDDAPEQSKLGL